MLPLPLRSLIPLAGLLFSGVVAAFFLAIISSQRIALLQGAAAVQLLLFIQWQTFGITVAKLGIDQAIFSVVSNDLRLRFSVADFLLTRTIPLALLAGAAIGWFISPIAGVVAAVTIVLDVLSLMFAADCNARQRYSVNAIANFLNYPLFFLLGFVLLFAGFGINGMYAAFLVSSIIKAAWIVARSDRPEDARLEQVQFTGSTIMAAQQIGNYLLFKSDQIVLIALTTLLAGHSHLLGTERYLFLAKYPELVSSGLVVLGLYVFPRMAIADLETRHRLVFEAPWLRWTYVALGVGLLLGIGLYQLTWNRDQSRSPAYWLTVVPFVAQAMLILPANAITYALVAKGYARTLVSTLVAGLLSGSVLLIGAVLLKSAALLSCIVPLQLLVFVVFGHSRRIEPGIQKALHHKRQG